ncbi:hypothetical protein J538_0047 [Acinetobacter sp. 272263]|nr:hypothetical protein J538_0047 [Acinetobacter sp. 272263]
MFTYQVRLIQNIIFTQSLCQQIIAYFTLLARDIDGGSMYFLKSRYPLIRMLFYTLKIIETLSRKSPFQYTLHIN